MSLLVGHVETIRSHLGLGGERSRSAPAPEPPGRHTLAWASPLSLLLLAASFLTTAYQGSGGHIHCHADADYQVDQTMIDAFCWMQGVHTLVAAPSPRPAPLYPGVRQRFAWDEVESVRPQSYYQWVSLVLVVLAFTCYWPRALWRRWEAGRLGKMLKLAGIAEDSDQKQPRLLAEYFCQHRASLRCYFLRFQLCRLLLVLLLAAQLYMLDLFFDARGLYLWRGYELALPANETGSATGSHLASTLFPLVSKCLFELFGQTGNPMSVDAVCLLPINKVSRVVFAGVWIGFVALAAWNALAAAGAMAMLAWPEARLAALRCLVPGAAGYCVARRVVYRGGYVIWRALWQIGWNAQEGRDVRELMSELDKLLAAEQADAETYSAPAS